MLDRIRLGRQPLAAAAAKMSRRKQACPIRSVKALDDPPLAVGEEESALKKAEVADGIVEKDCHESKTPTAEEANDVLENSPEFGPLVINTSIPSPTPPSSALDNTPPLTEDTTSPGTAQVEDSHPQRPSSPGLDIPPSSADVAPLSLTLPSTPTSPDHPSTPSSLNSSCSLLESSANKQRRGKKIMPVAGDDGKSRWQCPICNEQLGSDHDFTVHIRSHNTTQAKQPNTCTICGKVLSSQSSLDRHMLVHSGERPFRCKVCKMSFTTNGNMHRHSRIHGKEELKAAQTAAAAAEGGKPSKSSRSATAAAAKAAAAASAAAVESSPNNQDSPMSWHRPGVFTPERAAPQLPTPVSGVELQKLMADNKFIHPSHMFSSVVPNPFTTLHLDMNVLSHLMNSHKRSLFPEEDGPPSKRLRGEGEGVTEQRDRVQMPGHANGDRDGGDSVGSGSNNNEDGSSSLQVTRKSPGRKRAFHKCSALDKPQLDPQHAPAQDECKHCHKTFISLDYHLLQHHKDAASLTTTPTTTTKTISDKCGHGGTDSGPSAFAAEDVSDAAAFRCSKCEELFTSQHRLVVHNLLVHCTNQQAEQAVAEALAEGKNGVNRIVLEATMPGFADLDFMDFTASKFSLAAKARCEQMPRRSSSQFHNFTCQECSCSFPSRSSLKLHTASHKPQNWTKCSLCDCYFVSVDLLYTHMFKHAADKSFVESLECDVSENAGKPESMEKNDFLAMFELVASDELCGSKANEEALETISKEQNNQYFARLCQAYAKNKAKQMRNAGCKSEPNQEDSLPSHVPSTTTTHKNEPLIPSTDVPDDPSMSPPGGVPSPAAAQDGVMPPGFFSPLLAKSMMFPKGEFFGQDLSQLSASPAFHAGRFLSPLHSSPLMLGTEGEAAPQGQKKGVYKCKFCGSSFPNERTLKGHTRVHLGLSPYKCNMCSYSSADKSTLIRHMRTHNGQRPFKCNICEFPFTTKANCERHVRKRHGVTDKEEMERSVTYESYPTDLSEGIESFQSPDTVCQYCGTDFKFFRALKHHLKTHSSCRQKPFTCTKCLVGFSMKANAIRHVQKQHLDVPHKDIENYILVNELMQAEADDDSDNLAAGYDTGSPSPSSTPGTCGQDSTPPMAHSTPVFPATSKSLPQASPHPDGPLDFSLRNPELAARLTGMMISMMPRASSSGPTATGDDGEQPIDLTTKKKSPSSTSSSSLSPSPAAPSTTTIKQTSTPTKVSTSEVPCGLCKKVLSSKEDAKHHLIEVHQVSPAAFDSLPSSDNNNNTSGGGGAGGALPPQFMPVVMNPLQLTSLIQAHAAVAAGGGVPVFPAHPAFSHMQQKLAYLASPRAPIHPTLLASMAVGVKKEPGASAITTAAAAAAASNSNTATSTTKTASSINSSGSDSSCDLASVNKIIESTATQNIQIFLKPQVTNSGSDDSEPQTTPWESADEDSDQSLEQLYKQSLNGAIPVKSEPDAENMAIGDEDEDPDEEEDEEDENEDKDAERNAEEDGDSDGEMSTSDAMIKSANRIKEELGDSVLSPDSKLAADLLMQKSEPGSLPVKKKRNSYADSPHKLNCPHCPRSFPWVSSLNRHMLTHTGQKPFKCPRCPVTFSTKSNRERHLIRKHGVNMLDPASRQTMDRPYKCHLCVFSSFSTESNLLKHYKERHPGCTPPERYLMKMQDCEGETLDLGQQMDRLDEMTMASLDSSNMDGWSESASMDAEDMETPTLTPPKTAVSTMVENVVAALLKKEPKGSPAPASGVPTASTDTTHNGFDDNEDDSGDMPLISASFSGSAERHINPERDNYNVDKITYCWKCGDQFNSRKLLVRHLKEHNIDLPFKCYLCDASYDSRLECLLHQEKHHASDWAILKEKNGVESLEVFAERLDRIVERNCKTGQFVEEGEDGESVALATEEEGQVEMVASDYLQRKVYCSLCSKRFWSLQDLRRHMRSHTGERPFECDKCQKRFTLKHSMMRHRRKHTALGTTDSPTTLTDDEDEVQAVDSTGKAPAVNMGSGHKALRQHLAATVMRTSANIPTTVTDHINGLPTAQNSNDREGNEDDDGDDILHNLLGVESATIDQIIDAKGSAASLLGV